MRRVLLSVILVVLVAAAPAVGTVTAGSATAETAPTEGVALTAGTGPTEESAPTAATAPPSPADGNASELPERWNATLGGDGDDKLTTGVQTDDGYLVVGWRSDSGDDDGYVAMVDESGRTTWEQTYGESGTDRLFDVKDVEDGYLVAGYSSKDSRSAWNGWVMKLGEDGEKEWERTYDGDGASGFWSLARSGDSIYAGGWQKDGSAEAWLVEIDGDDGSEVWSRSYDTLRSGSDEYVNSIFADESGDLLLIGNVEGSSIDPSDAWTLKVDGEGEVKWEQEYGGIDYDHISDAAATDDGGYVLAGRSVSDGSSEDGWLLKIDGDGEKQWEKTYGTERDDALFGVLAADGGYVLTGAKHQLSRNGADGWMVRVDGDGKKQWERTYGNQYWDKFWPAVDGHDGGYLAVGESTSYSENQDGWLVRIGGPASAAIQDADAERNGTTVALDGSPVRAVTLADANASGVLTVSEFANLSALSPPGDPMYAVKMTGPESAENESATVELSAPTDSGKVDDFRIAQQTDDGWDILETSVVGESNETVVLSAETDGTATLAVIRVDAPTAAIGGETVTMVGESVTLNADDSYAENTTLEAYEWSIAGERYDGDTASVSFDDPGEREVELTVTDAAGLRDTQTQTLLVNDRPEISSVETPDSASVGTAADFSVDVTDEVGDVTVTWRFDDGEVTGESIEHSFGTTGTKTVELVVEDEYGATVTEELTVEVGSQDDDDVDETGSDGDEANDGGVPGFGVVATLVALVAAALAARRV